MNDPIISDRLFEFSVRVIRLVYLIGNNTADNRTAEQLLKTGTSPSVHYEQARRAESESDFNQKIEAVLKGLKKTVSLLKRIDKEQLIPSYMVTDACKEAERLLNGIARSINEAHKNGKINHYN